MIDLDHSLNKIANMPVPAKLADIDNAVFASLSIRHTDSRRGTRLMGVAGVAALALGIVGGSFASGPALASGGPAPFASATALAPSTLLGQ